MPGSPDSNTRWALPSRTAIQASFSWSSSRCHVLAPQFLTVECAGPELSVDRCDGVVRLQREVALEHLGVPVVGAQRRASVAQREMCFHLNSNGRFVGRLQVDDALGMPDRRLVVAALGSLVSQSHQDSVRLGSQLRSLVHDPVVVGSWKEVP
jgi:hypothetical protein